MKISMVIVTLNEEKHLPRCLASIENLDHAGLDVEVVVADSGSTDRTQEIARSYGARVVECGRGIPLARNVGGRAAEGDILAYVDSDVELLEPWFQNVAAHFSDTTTKVVGAPPRIPEEASWIAKAYALHWGVPPEGERTPQLESDVRLLSTHCLAVGRDVFEAVGGFREDLLVDEDTFFILKAKDIGTPVICDLDFAYYHYGEPGSLKEFFNRVIWGSNYQGWVEALLRGDFREAWRPQYFYGAVIGAETVLLGLSLAAPLGGWQIGVPVSLGMFGASTFIPALRTAQRHKAFGKLGELCMMYGTYGLATAAAMIGAGRDKANRWR